MNAVVTGASSGIGREIAKKLLEEGYSVVGIGRDFDGSLSRYPAFRPVVLDLRDEEALVKFAGEPGFSSLDVLVNCAGCAYYGLHENLQPKQISEMVDVNLKAPLLLTALLASRLRRAEGLLVNVSSVTGKQSANPHGAAYGATKAGLTSFGLSFFEEIRKQGVGVVNVHPDLTDTALYRNADFTVTGEPDSSLFPEDVAEAVLFAVRSRKGLCVTDLTVRPQRNRIVKKQDNG